MDGAKKYVTFFMKHPDVIAWYHAVPLHIIPASREMLHSAKYQDNPVIQKRMDVLKFLDSIWTKGVPLYYWDGKELNPLHRPLPQREPGRLDARDAQHQGHEVRAGGRRGRRPGPQEDEAGRLNPLRNGERVGLVSLSPVSGRGQGEGARIPRRKRSGHRRP